MPFGLFKKRQDEAQQAPGPGALPAPGPSGGVAFDGLTEEWRLVGIMHVDGRLSDALNRREAIAISDVSWAPADGSAPFEPVPGLKSVDPYDLIVVLAGEGTLPTLTEAEKAAHRIHKIPYDVQLEAPPFRVVGTVHLHPGTDPDRILDRSTELFVPMTDATAFIGTHQVDAPGVEVLLVNRSYVREVRQVDRQARQALGQPGPLSGAGADER